jgi:hypothetical protein
MKAKTWTAMTTATLWIIRTLEIMMEEMTTAEAMMTVEAMTVAVMRANKSTPI